MTWIFMLFLLLTAALGQAEPIRSLPWSFQPLDSVASPAFEKTEWVQTRLDGFILSKQESAELGPAAAADDRVLLRRLFFDLIGLPPTPDQLARFQRRALEGRQVAIREAVDSLLASPHYGERWARHWLDLARYTDKTSGWLKSLANPWRYRDWVVNALNEDLPYSQFVRQQLANDLIVDGDPQDNAALGFLGLSPTYWKELQLAPDVIKTTVADEWEERMDAVGRTFLGLTLGCARCHDHKTDPISQVDYYAIAGVFASVRISDRPMMTEKAFAPIAAARDRVAKLKDELGQLREAQKKKNSESANAATIAKLERQIASIKTQTPHYNTPMVSGVEEAALYVTAATGRAGTELEYRAGEARDLAVHRRGNPNRPGAVVSRQFLGAFPWQSGKPRLFERGSGRLDLADAIVNEASPLSARVIVNRVWRHHFGRGLVATPSELGHAGEQPTHPELLNDLSYRFVQNGWSLKWLHREILLSATWQQGNGTPSDVAADSNNDFYTRMRPRRLEVEVWRDAALMVSGELDPKRGGQGEALDHGRSVRRTLYGLINRRDLDSFLRLHDFPDPTAHAAARVTTQTPLQQLFSLNASFMQRRAKALRDRLLLRGPDIEGRVQEAYQILFQRRPTDEEYEIAKRFFARGDESNDLWQQYAHALLASNEFWFVN